MFTVQFKASRLLLKLIVGIKHPRTLADTGELAGVALNYAKL
jgi:hypothetical protein